VVASPDYLRQAGIPVTLAELAEHQCIQFLLPRNGRPVPWLFRDQGRDLELTTTGDYCCAQDVLAGTSLARHGAGLFQALGFIVEDDLRQGRLVEVLQAYAGRSRPFSLLYPSGRHLPQRVRVFVDFLVQAVGE
jgi:DNA-binding transcriptional LysR family regulator